MMPNISRRQHKRCEEKNKNSWNIVENEFSQMAIKFE